MPRCLCVCVCVGRSVCLSVCLSVCEVDVMCRESVNNCASPCRRCYSVVTVSSLLSSHSLHLHWPLTLQPRTLTDCETARWPVWVPERRISPPRFLAECPKRRLNQGSFVLLYFRLSALFDLYLVSVTLFSCTVFVFRSGGALNSTHSLTHSPPRTLTDHETGRWP